MGARRAPSKQHIRDRVCGQKSARGRVQERNLPPTSGSGAVTALSGPKPFTCKDAVSQQAARPLVIHLQRVRRLLGHQQATCAKRPCSTHRHSAKGWKGLAARADHLARRVAGNVQEAQNTPGWQPDRLPSRDVRPCVGHVTGRAL